MSFFRIYVYLKLKHFFLTLHKKRDNSELKIKKILNNFTNKKFTILTGQLRVGFYLTLRYLKHNNPKKNEIIINSYNLPDMVNICKNLNLKLIFPHLNQNIFISEKDLVSKINKKTLAVVFTNIFNNSSDINKIKKICKRRKINLIEDNAIYFGNYIKIKNKKKYSGSFGDYTLHSFNIMKNISGMFGGSVSTNDKNFFNYSINELESFCDFPQTRYLKQCVIYFILKLFSINILYKYFFFNILSWAHRKNNYFLLKLVYPSLDFKKEKHSSSFFTKISEFTKELILLQLSNKKEINFIHISRKKNNLYYEKVFTLLKIKNIKLIKIREKNFQNFNEYPIILDNKKIKYLLENYLFKKGIETKRIQYADCDKIFKNENFNNYEDRIICLPNHPKIKKKYIDYISLNIKNFFNKKLYEKNL